MDFIYFKEYLKTQEENRALNDKEFKMEERVFVLEQKMNNSVGREELK